MTAMARATTTTHGGHDGEDSALGHGEEPMTTAIGKAQVRDSEGTAGYAGLRHASRSRVVRLATLTQGNLSPRPPRIPLHKNGYMKRRHMAHLLVLNLVFFIIPICGATAFAVIVLRILRSGEPPAPGPPPGGSKIHTPSAGPHDLARSA
jgi:hypothetical protein